MSSRWNPCNFSCPPSTVTIQPPPFVVCIPGPAISCPDQPLCIEQCNPCALPYTGRPLPPGPGTVCYPPPPQQQGCFRPPPPQQGCNPCKRF